MWRGARRRAYERMVRAITAPVVLMHGTKDRLVPIASARAAAAAFPEWAYHESVNVGHVPMIEIPDEVVARVDDLLPPLRRSAASLGLAGRSSVGCWCREWTHRHRTRESR